MSFKRKKKALNIRPIEEDSSFFESLKPPLTFGRPEKEALLAQDRAIQSSYDLISHAQELGQMPHQASFIGYSALQSISQNGLIRACIETLADDMTRSWGCVRLDDAQLAHDLNAALEKFDVQNILHEVAEMVGYYGGCLLFIDTGVDEATLQMPLEISSVSGEIGKDDFQGFRVIDPINVFPAEYNVENPLKADFYKPRYWYIMGKKVHASRLIRFVANEVPQLYKPIYNFFGIAQAQVLWDYVIHFNQCREATAELMTKFSMTIMKTPMEETLTLSGGIANLENRLRLMSRFRNNNSIIAIDKDMEDIVKVETPLGGLTDICRQSLEFLAAINRTPAVKLLGISPSGFNATGESDIRNYYDHVRGQREKLFKKGMRIIMACIQLFVTGKIDARITFSWNELGQDDESAVSSVLFTKANTLAAYLDRGVISKEEARQYIATDPDSGFSFIEPDDVPKGEGQGDAENGFSETFMQLKEEQEGPKEIQNVP